MKYLLIAVGAYAAVYVAAAIRTLLSFRVRPYRVRFQERSSWGDLYAIVAPDGRVVGFDRLTVARQRCSALNQAKNAGTRQSAE
jgi:hypothetical protein